MENKKYFLLHSTVASKQPAIKAMEKKYGIESYSIIWEILEQIVEKANQNQELTFLDLEMDDKDIVKTLNILNESGIFEIENRDDGNFCIKYKKHEKIALITDEPEKYYKTNKQ